MDASVVVNRFCELAPLAVMSRIILDEIISDELELVYEDHRQRGCQRDLLFSQLTRRAGTGRRSEQPVSSSLMRRIASSWRTIETVRRLTEATYTRDSFRSRNTLWD